ncbi:unnamed protein product [Eruca vesicaria subsp. sativa]|uniref:TIR domain-containing protein n=1 Tax=Eruca vesicaria subsp. sativa TaxID=29727 RepID=A0ABC8J6G1_ERUVS|nr:unnamed protein product [Eruca vesicaria subsp. sativa]
MFCMYAFGQKSPYDGFEKLAQEITTLSGGLPVGIRFMGSYFRGKSKKEWENELPRLKTSVDGGLGSILKFTYDALSGHDKEIAHHYISSLRDVKGLSEARQELTITNEDLKLLRNLKWMDLIRSRGLKELPATNLKRLNLSYCSSLGKLPPPVEKTSMLKKLDVGSCSKLVTFPNLELAKLSQLINLRFTHVDFHPTNWYTKAEMNKAIATDISTKLNNAAPFSEFEGLVGMGDHIKKMEELLRLDLDEVRVIGISGLLGSGKTTIAKYINQLLAHQFQLSTFINIKGGDPIFFHDEHKAKLHLQTQLFSQLINEKDTGESLHLGVAQESFKDKKVLVVLEDVDQFGVRQLEVLVKELRGFGPGSRIIITSQDRKFLKAQGIKHIYKVGFPASDEALQIFCMYAFGQKSPYDGFEKLAQEITTLCGELPAGIRFMGSYFRGKSEEEWENELPRLKTSVDGGLESILKFTYDGLSGHDKEIAHHYISSLRDVELTEKMETFLRKGLSQVRPKLTITNQDVKENVNTSERASRGMSSNGLLPTVHIYCADTLQYSFASHLSLDFHRKGIVASVHCNESLDVKEGASASVVVLSKDYLSSPSCLDTLVRVLQCRRKHVQLVVPVFYDFSPSDMTVPKQESDHRIVNWTSALKELRESPDIQSR